MKWFRMYEGVLDNPKVQRLPAETFRAWVNLLCLARRCGGVLPCIEDIAFALRQSDSKVEAFIAALKKARLLDVTEDGLVPHDWNEHQYVSDDVATRVKRHRERQRNVECNVTSNVSEMANVTPSETETEAETEAEKKIPRARTRSASDHDPDFEAFWLAYPRKVAKPRALKAWRKALGRAPPAEIIAAAERFAAASAGKDPEFLPHPASWLNDDRFNDPLPKPAGDACEIPGFLQRKPASATDRALAGIAAVAAKLGEAGNGTVTPGRGAAADHPAEHGGANGRDHQGALVIDAVPASEAVDHAGSAPAALPDAGHERD